MSYINTKVEKYQGVIPKNKEYKFTKLIKQNNIIDEIKMTFKPEITIKKLDKHNYVNIKTGEMNGFMPKVEGKQMRNRRSLRKIFTDLRYLITTNFEGVTSEKFLTLTYADQTNDTKKIQKDLDAFNHKLKRFCKNEIGYINIVEPHESGNFHIHSLIKHIDDTTLPVDYKDIHRLWGHGYVTVEELSNVDHIGAYFIAYFSNLEIPEEDLHKYPDDIKEMPRADGNGTKKVIKGRRLDFYPDYMQIYRSSRNLKKPEIIDEFEKDEYDEKFNVTYKLISTDENGNTAEGYITKKQHKKRRTKN